MLPLHKIKKCKAEAGESRTENKGKKNTVCGTKIHFGNAVIGLGEDFSSSLACRPCSETRGR